MLTYTKDKMGELTIKQHGKKFKIQIRRGNCLAVFIYVARNPESTGKHDRYLHGLYSFFADTQHMRNMAKDCGLFGDEVVSVKLNTFYKESLTMLPYFTKAGYKVTCYYKNDEEK